MHQSSTGKPVLLQLESPTHLSVAYFATESNQKWQKNLCDDILLLITMILDLQFRFYVHICKNIDRLKDMNVPWFEINKRESQ